MSDLSPEARELLKAGRDLLRPTDADRARSVTLLKAELGEAALRDSTTGSARAATSGTGAAVAAGAVVAGVLAAAWIALRSPEPLPPVETTAPASASAAPTATNAPAPPAAVPSPPAETVAPNTPSPKRSAAPADHLAEEVAILTRAATFLNTGQSADALRALEEHRRRFPNGLLTEERRGARARALCALGRRSEAEEELARMAQQSAGSPHFARARRFCGISSKP